MRSFRLHIHESFAIARPPEAVFAFTVGPGDHAHWQTIKTHVTPLTEGPTVWDLAFARANKVGPHHREQVVEVPTFEPERAFAVRAAESPAVDDGAEGRGLACGSTPSSRHRDS